MEPELKYPWKVSYIVARRIGTVNAGNIFIDETNFMYAETMYLALELAKTFLAAGYRKVIIELTVA